MNQAVQLGRSVNIDIPFTNGINDTVNHTVDPKQYFSI